MRPHRAPVWLRIIVPNEFPGTGTGTAGHVPEIEGDDVREIADRVVRFCSFLLYDSGSPFPRGNARVHTNTGESWNRES